MSRNDIRRTHNLLHRIVKAVDPRASIRRDPLCRRYPDTNHGMDITSEKAADILQAIADRATSEGISIYSATLRANVLTLAGYDRV